MIEHYGIEFLGTNEVKLQVRTASVDVADEAALIAHAKAEAPALQPRGVLTSGCQLVRYADDSYTERLAEIPLQ
jgi:hypothetical protein